MSKPSILIVEDEAIVAMDIRQQLERFDYDIAGIASSRAEAVSAAERLRPQLALMDIRLGDGMDGIDAAVILRRQFSIPSVFLTAYAAEQIVERAKAAEPLGYLIKPFDEHSLRTTVEIALHRDAADRQVRASEARYRAVVRSAHDATVTVDAAGRIVDWSPAAETTFGYTTTEAIGQSAASLLGIGDVVALVDTGLVQNRAARHKSGHAVPVEQSLSRWETADGAFVTAFLRDISQRLQSERALRLQGAALSAAANAIIITDQHGEIEWVNPAFSTLTGYGSDEAIGKNPRDLIKSGEHDPAFYSNMWETICAGRVWEGEVTNRRKDGTHYVEQQTITPVKDDGGRITHFVGIKRDLTAEKHLREQFLQAQKMEVVGRLAGGIAHDFNNLLTIINGESELAIADLPTDSTMRASFGYILDAGQRAARLTKQLLTFSRKHVASPSVFGLAAHVATLVPMIRRLVGEDVRLAVAVPNPQAPDQVRIDTGQLEQVLLNLAVNARDAMPHGGTLTIEVSPVDLDAESVRAHSGLAAGRYVMLAVTDTGIGISDDVRARIFEPFFTTKPHGEGTGLGLAMVYGVVKQSGGSIEVLSEPGHGASFRLFFPEVTAPVDEEPAPTTQPARGNETVILVEDARDVRETTARMLRSAGYTVFPMGSGAEALAWIQAHADGADLLLTDVVMPGMTGPELAAAVGRISQKLRVLFVSGYTDDKLAASVLADPARFLAKPFTTAALMGKVRAVLDAPLTAGRNVGTVAPNP